MCFYFEDDREGQIFYTGLTFLKRFKRRIGTRMTRIERITRI